MNKDYIDTNYCYQNDCPGKDPDKYSKKLAEAHNMLWSKETKSGFLFEFDKKHKPFREHAFKDRNGVVHILTSDCIAYAQLERDIYKDYQERLGKEYVKEYRRLSRTIGGHILFPGKFENGCRNTINRARGCSPKLNDRMDLTLECIRRFYEDNEDASNPLFNVLNATKYFYDLFEDFKGYIDFFLLNDYVDDNYNVKFLLPFNGFENETRRKLTFEETNQLVDLTNDLTRKRNRKIEECLKF